MYLDDTSLLQSSTDPPIARGARHVKNGSYEIRSGILLRACKEYL